MKNLRTYLYYLGVGSAVVAVILAFAAMETRATGVTRMNPESAIAMAIAAFVFLRASEQAPR